MPTPLGHGKYVLVRAILSFGWIPKGADLRHIVVVFDLCSSTTIIEDLAKNDRVADYGKLADGMWAYLHTKTKSLRFDIYKFLGDGFILLFEDRAFVDDILVFCRDLAFFCEQLLVWFKNEYLDLETLPRQGITIGIAEGPVWPIRTINVRGEFVGRPITLACRLQGALDKPSDINCALVQSSLYKYVSNRLLKKACRSASYPLRNMGDGAKIKCYRYDTEPFVLAKWGALRGQPIIVPRPVGTREHPIRNKIGLVVEYIISRMLLP
jgi:hypothetical protein